MVWDSLSREQQQMLCTAAARDTALLSGKVNLDRQEQAQRDLEEKAYANDEAIMANKLATAEGVQRSMAESAAAAEAAKLEQETKGLAHTKAAHCYQREIDAMKKQKLDSDRRKAVMERARCARSSSVAALPPQPVSGPDWPSVSSPNTRSATRVHRASAANVAWLKPGDGKFTRVLLHHLAELCIDQFTPHNRKLVNDSSLALLLALGLKYSSATLEHVMINAKDLYPVDEVKLSALLIALRDAYIRATGSFTWPVSAAKEAAPAQFQHPHSRRRPRTAGGGAGGAAATSSDGSSLSRDSSRRPASHFPAPAEGSAAAAGGRPSRSRQRRDDGLLVAGAPSASDSSLPRKTGASSRQVPFLIDVAAGDKLLALLLCAGLYSDNLIPPSALPIDIASAAVGALADQSLHADRAAFSATEPTPFQNVGPAASRSRATAKLEGIDLFVPAASANSGDIAAFTQEPVDTLWAPDVVVNSVAASAIDILPPRSVPLLPVPASAPIDDSALPISSTAAHALQLSVDAAAAVAESTHIAKIQRSYITLNMKYVCRSLRLYSRIMLTRSLFAPSNWP